MAHSDTNGTNGTGRRNTKLRNVCLTINNYTDSDVEILESLKPMMTKWAWQSEVGETGTNGTPHLQIALCFKNARSFAGMKKLFPRAHIEAARNQFACLNYCTKSKTADGKIQDFNLGENNKPPKLVVKDPLKDVKLHDWQIKILEILKSEPDDRTIHWYYEETGSSGKSTFCKHICINNEDAIVLSGNAKDMKYGITSIIKEKKLAPRIILIDIPRSTDEKFISYSGIESIKNGIFFSTKYESAMCIYDNPHVFIFSNYPPDTTKFSKDRWHIVRIGEGEQALTTPLSLLW